MSAPKAAKQKQWRPSLTTRVTLRLELAEKEQIKRDAEAEHRTFSQQIIHQYFSGVKK